MEGLKKVESIAVTSETRIYQDLLRSDIDRRLISSQKYL
jgi:hypothetical protein